MSGPNLFFQSMGEVIGPIDAAELRRMADGGAIQPDTLIRKGEHGKWVPASSAKGLFNPSPTAQSPRAHTEPAQKPVTQSALPTGGPPDLPMDDEKWFYAGGGERIGPLPEAKLRSLIRDGQIGLDTLVWHGKMDDWKPASETKLKTSFDCDQPPPLKKSASISNGIVWTNAFAPILYLLLPWNLVLVPILVN